MSGELLWQPQRERIEGSQMYAFMRRLSNQYGFAPDWPSFHRWSVEHNDLFWGEMWNLAGIHTTSPASAVRTGEGMLGTKWFPGLEFNFASHLLRFRDHRTALWSVDELGRRRSLSYGELYEAVRRCARALREAGVVRGDRVAAFMPNVPETVIAMLAASSLGAIFSSCSPDFGINGVLDRFGQIEPKVLFTVEAYSYGGKKLDLLDKVKAIVEKIPSIGRVVVVPFLSASVALDKVRGGQRWEEFLDGRKGPVDELEFESVPFDHPLYIMYSSGTTGIPKCIVHGHGGTLIQHMKELMLHCDLRRDDTIFYFTTCGWMMWNWLVSALGVGATLVLYEGNPAHPTADHLWRMAQELGISVFGTSPKFVAACEKAGLCPGREFDLSKLRAVLSTGSPLTVENFRWVYRNVKADLQLSSICGGTDIISCFMLGNPMLPVYAGEIQCLGLGMDVKALDETGKPVIGQKGELVCCTPFPSQPVGFWNDPDGSKYRKAYFEDYPGMWRHGDFIEITEHGGVIVYGRSDATLNPGGVRIGTAEIYRQVESIPEIVDSIVVGKETPDADVEICLFVVLKNGIRLDEKLAGRIRKTIAEGTTKRHVPKHIKQVTAIPYTISGKKVEIAVQRMIHGRPVPNRDALANPAALDEYAGII